MNLFEIEIDHEHKIVRAIVAGIIYQDAGEKIITDTRTQAARYEYDIICDIRRATTKVMFASWYELPRKLKIYQDPKARRAKTALLVSKTDEALDEYKFYEIVTDNVGLKLRVFFEEAEAFAWLKGKKGEIAK